MSNSKYNQIYGNITEKEWQERFEPVTCKRCGCSFPPNSSHYCIGSSQQPNESDEEYEMRKKYIEVKR